MEGIHRLDQFAKRHPYAPERAAWGRDVRNVILSNGYRVLYDVPKTPRGSFASGTSVRSS